MKIKLVLFITTLLYIQATKAQEENKVLKKKTYTTKFINESPEIDGKINDAVWQNLDWGVDFTQKAPTEGIAPTYQTKFKIGYDEKYLYIAIRAFDDEPEKIERRLSRRDGFAGDRVNVLIDSYHDKRTAFVFTTTAAGVKGEEIVTRNGNNWDASWNPIWYTNAVIDDKGWTAEMKIPFSQLRFGKAKEQVWGLNIIRQFFREQERSLWQRIPNNVAGFVSEAGELHGLVDLKSQKQLEIQPFTVLQYDSYKKEGSNPFRDGSDFKINGGLDAKIGVTNDLTLDLTINPDFGQVEADPGAIALDGFQIFFNEQRPFFVENKNIFDFRFANGPDNVFYSRRIGRSPQTNPSVGVGEYADVPINTSILGAAKFSGKTRNGWSIGVLETLTSNEYAEIDANGTRREELVEPLTNYFVARAQKDFNDRKSYVGGIFTATNRNLQGLNSLRKAAYTGGMDFRHEWDDRNYFVQGDFVASHVTGSKESIEATQRSLTHLFQRVDASHVEVDPNRTSLTGTGGRIFGGKRGGGNWRYWGGLNWRSPELELNDIGFLRQADEIRQFANVRYLWQNPTKIYREANVRMGVSTSFDFEGNYNRIQYTARGNVNWINNWWTELEFGHKPRIFINSFLRGGPRWRFSEENFAVLFFGSDRSKKFSFRGGTVQSTTKQDNFAFRRYVLGLNYQPLDALNVSLEATFNENPNKTQYVTQTDYNGGKRYILGNIDQKTWATTLRLNYSINPNLSIQFYGQPFISRGRYSDFNFVNNSIAENLNDRVTWYGANQISKTNNPIAIDLNNDGELEYDLANGGYQVDDNGDGNLDYAFGNPDFSAVQFRSNLVVRWEYIPGSELFFVWSQGGAGGADPRESLTRGLQDQILNQQLENTFLIKATYRFVR
ncbi:hydrolase [Tenacibaculum sp. S7007]|uniref:Hydrolase n=1 Tax=Tenacibaculum pelagium TaxID=2759527 RepID=A0A839ASK5_9FLAO|nr:DUF5916 domain-containing protein [Tenacibaculum pelagium]MBA6157259.1 hydrolase [Tenacibaculum pelagium]